MVRDKWVLVVIFTFFSVWIYTEVTEKLERDVIYAEFRNFHDAGGRFTADDGLSLADRICHLERLHNIECRD